jgi:hypothetical protein
VRTPISITEVWPDIPIELKKWIVKHVSTWHNDNIPFGLSMVQLTEAGYSMEFGPKAFKCIPRERQVLVLHEIQHMIRGDVLHQWKNRNKPDYNPALWNTAADAVINNKDLVNMCGPNLREGILTFDRLQDAHPDELGHFELNPGTRPIYDALLPKCQQQEEELKRLLEQGGCSIGTLKAGEGDTIEGEIKHLEAVLDAPKSYSINPPQIRNKVKSGIVSNKPLPRVARLLHQWLRRWKVAGDTKVRTRSWLRESRLFPDAPGYVRLPTAKLVLALDLSGSMSGMYEELWAATNWLRKFGTFGIEVWVWADGAAKARTDGTHPDVGGGTCIEELYKQAPKCDVMVIFTDGYFSSGVVPPSHVGRILWVLSHDGEASAIHLRGRDGVTNMGDKSDET